MPSIEPSIELSRGLQDGSLVRFRVLFSPMRWWDAITGSRSADSSALRGRLLPRAVQLAGVRLEPLPHRLQNLCLVLLVTLLERVHDSDSASRDPSSLRRVPVPSASPDDSAVELSAGLPGLPMVRMVTLRLRGERVKPNMTLHVAQHVQTVRVTRCVNGCNTVCKWVCVP